MQILKRAAWVSLSLGIVVSLCWQARVAPAATMTEQNVKWHSGVLDADIPATIFVPDNAAAGKALVTVVYLKNLSVPRIGQDTDDDIIADLLKDGTLVIAMDYAKSPKAVAGVLNPDFLKVRDDLLNKHFLTDFKIDPARTYILAEGFRIKRDVVFYQEPKRTLAMDIQYPGHPIHPVPTLMEISCDNQNRWGQSSVLFCHDTLIDGGMLVGFAGAMIDEPVDPPYKGFDDPMPGVIYRLKAAVRTLRKTAPTLGLSEKIGAIGFSRGATLAGILETTEDRADLEGDGPNQGISSDVQAILTHGQRYDYLDLLKDDPMLPRFTKKWGDVKEKQDVWAAHGAMYYLPKDKTHMPPIFFDTSDAEQPAYRYGMERFSKKLGEMGVDQHYQVDKDGRGHHFSLDPKTLEDIYAFFGKNLN